MATIPYEQLVEIAEEAGLLQDKDEDSAIFTDYSGRYMYGRTCIGFVADTQADLLHIGAAIQTILGADGFHDLGTIVTDSLGQGIVVYFPGADCTDAPE